MIRINLLPHREQKKALHRLRFQVLLGISLVLAVIMVSSMYMFFDGRITRQEARNQFLQDQIVVLDKQIHDISMLKKQRDDLLARKQLVERLQQGKNVAVHIFDQLVRRTPDGIYLKSIKQSGNVFTLNGYALAGSTVSAYMRELSKSDVFDAPMLQEVKATIINNQRVNEFTLTTTLRQSGMNSGPNPAQGPKP